MSCSYRNREEDIISYLYDELEPEARLAFEAHMDGCAPCREEVTAFRATRKPLANWMPPEPARAFEWGAAPTVEKARPWARLSDIPAWAQVAAATLFLGLAAGAANLDIRYDQQGLSVRTGWMAPAAEPQTPPNDEPWRAELAALEQQFRTEVATLRTSAPANSPDVTASVRAMVAASEQRQQRELALRVQTVMRDVDLQRQADHERIDYNLGLVGAQVIDLSNYIVRASSQSPSQPR